MKYLSRTRFKKEIVAEFVAPERKSNKVIIFLSGMPSYPNKDKYLELCEFFSKQGFWCFVPRFRGSWESGGTFLKRPPHIDIFDIIEALPAGFIDLWDGKKYSIKNPEVYILGSSFGGAAALLSSGHPTVKKVIAFSPVIDWKAMESGSEPVSKLRAFVREAFGEGYRIAADGWRKLEEGNLSNPIDELQKIDGSKILIFHAEDDTVVPAKPLEKFINETGAKLILQKVGGHFGMEALQPKFRKSVLTFLK